jgi:hypothetical protein
VGGDDVHGGDYTQHAPSVKENPLCPGKEGVNKDWEVGGEGKRSASVGNFRESVAGRVAVAEMLTASPDDLELSGVAAVSGNR